jgi:hypothetical protein
MAHDPRNTHLMVSHRVAGVTKPMDHLQPPAAAAPPTLSLVLTSFRRALIDPH